MRELLFTLRDYERRGIHGAAPGALLKAIRDARESIEHLAAVREAYALEIDRLRTDLDIARAQIPMLTTPMNVEERWAL